VKIVLDTNCFISCIGKKSKFRKLFDKFLEGKLTLCVSSEILLEYEEKFLEFWGEEVTNNLLGVLLTSENVLLQPIYFNFNLVSGDADDNKFVDTYISSSADFLVTNDAKLLLVGRNEFPEVKTISLVEFFDFIHTSNQNK